MIKLILFLLYFTNSSYAEDSDLCKYFKYCGGSTRSGSQSLPSTSSAANLNPGNISSIKGFGIETIYQPRNNPSFDLVTGNGKIGALISPTLENSFFGNRAVEIDDVYLVRSTSKVQYKNKKLNLSIGAKLIDKKNIGISFGVSGKRNPDIKKINMGYGLTARLGILNVGAYFYNDDVKINLLNYVNPYTLSTYAIYYNSSTYQEKFLVTTFTVGTKIKNISLDFGLIKTKYKFYTENTNITLYSGSYSYQNFLFSFALRKEESPNLQFVFDRLMINRKKSSSYYGAECLIGRSLVIGMQYNYYYLNEWSGKLTLFF